MPCSRSPGGGLLLGGCLVLGGSAPRGCLLLGGGGGTHPTGMHSCLVFHFKI